MTLRELHERIKEVVDENDRKGNTRNDYPVFFGVLRNGKRKNHYYEIDFVSAGCTGICANGEKIIFTSICGNENTLMVPGLHEKKSD